MALAPRLDLRQSQSLVMTPQLRQAIKLLQSSNMEVTAFVEEELERNPLLERDERPEARTGAEDRVAEPPPSEPANAHEAAVSGSLPAADAAPLDADYDNVFEADGWRMDGAGRGFDDHHFQQCRQRDARQHQPVELVLRLRGP